jgi:hypothetical protein
MQERDLGGQSQAISRIHNRTLVVVHPPGCREQQNRRARFDKHQSSFLHQLDNLATVKRLVAFYVTEHNETLPHSAFDGQTRDEVYFGRGGQVPDDLAARRRIAREQSRASNRSTACSGCPRAAPPPRAGTAA